MKIQKLALFVLVSTVSFSAIAGKDFLWNKRHCSTEPIQCRGESILAHDHVGRCGCLNKDDYLDPNTCRTALIMCDELRGETYSTLTSNNEFIGCGCYKTR